MKTTLLSLVLFSALFSVHSQKLRSFPKGFQFGAASSSYQIEGAWNVSGKGENIWDHIIHTRPDFIVDRSSGDDAVKSYEYYMRDVEALADLGVDYYRFSVSWTRILPEGFATKINADGIKYYNNLINALLAKGIQPEVTIYHWDLPQAFQDIGGWANPLMADYFLEFARVCFENFGDRVKTWVTVNEPREICLLGYGETGMAPALNYHGVAEYLCTHTLIRGHGKAYRLYDEKYRPTQKGRIGVTISSTHHEPADQSAANALAAKTRTEFEIGWFANPIFSKEGDYPAVMKENIARKSKEQGYPTSRLPEFTKEEIAMIKGSADFFGINHYSSLITAVGKGNELIPSFGNDHETDSWQDPSWPPSGSSWLKVTPWGFRKLLNTLRDLYNNPEFIIFENGFSTSDGRLNDTDRVEYYHGYLNSMLDAIEIDGVNVTSYTAWCLADNFEWRAGYTELFGLYSTNFTDPKRTLTPKASAKFYGEIAKTKQILSVE